MSSSTSLRSNMSRGILAKITSETNVFLPNTTLAYDFPAFVCLSPHCGHLILVCRAGKCIDLFWCLRQRFDEHIQNKGTSYPILVRGQITSASTGLACSSVSSLNSSFACSSARSCELKTCGQARRSWMMSLSSGCTAIASSSVSSPSSSSHCGHDIFFVSDKGELSTARVEKRADP